MGGRDANAGAASGCTPAHRLTPAPTTSLFKQDPLFADRHTHRRAPGREPLRGSGCNEVNSLSVSAIRWLE